MPRKRRIEFPGAVYHVLSRGNYRKELFLEEGGGEGFEETLMEALDRCGWRVFFVCDHRASGNSPEVNSVGTEWVSV